MKHLNQKNNQLELLALQRLKGLKTREKLVLWEMYSQGEGIFKLSSSKVQGLLQRPIRGWEPQEALREAAQEIELLERTHINTVLICEEHYPRLLKEIFDPPLVLYYRGVWPQDLDHCLAVVGTRTPTGSGKVAAYELGQQLGHLGFTVVSGLARGIDREAHAGAVEAQARTIAVLGNGIDDIYPRSSAPLARKILNTGGLIVSEYAPGVPPLKFHFPARNRIISGLSRAVIVVQAPLKSGALITADFAAEQNRDLFVHQVGVTGSASSGTSSLADEGAVIISSASQILRGLQLCPENLPGDDVAGPEGPDAQPSEPPETELVFSLRGAGLKLAAIMEQELFNR